MARDVTVRLSADIQGYLRALDQAADATERAASSAEQLDQAAQQAARSAQSTAQGVGQATTAWSDLDAANRSAAQGVSESSEALHRMSGGLSGTASEAEIMAANLRGAGDGLTGLTGSFAEGLEIGGGFRDTIAAVAGVARDTLTSGLRSAVTAGRDFFEMARDNRAEFTQMAGVLATAGGGLVALSGYLLNVGIQYNTLQQVAGRALETMTGSASAAAEQMERLHAFADESPFARQTWIQAQQQLMAFGMEAERVVPTLEGVQNAVAAIGGGDAEIMRLVDILGQIEGQGKITGQELQRLGQMGINAAEIIGQAMGVSGNEIRTQITAGALDAETAITALTEGMMMRFDGASEGLRETMTGALDRIQARIRDLGSIIAAPLVSPEGGGFLVEAINQAADFGSKLLELPEPLLQVAGLGAGVAGSATLMAAGFFAAAPRVLDFAEGIGTTLTRLRDFGAAHPRMSSGLRNLGTAAAAAAAGLAAIAALDYMWERFRTAPPDIEATERALRQLASTGRTPDGLINVAEALDYVDERGNILTRNAPGWVSGLVGAVSGSHGLTVAAQNVEYFGEAVENVDAAMAGMVSSNNWGAVAANVQQITADFEASGRSTEEMIEALPALMGALQDLALDAGVSASETQLLRIATSEAALEALAAGENWAVVNQAYETGEYVASRAASSTLSLRDALSEQAELAEQAASAISELTGEMSAFAGLALDAEATVDGWIASVAELDEALEAEGYTLDRNTEQGRANREMLRDLAADTWDVAAAKAAEGGSLDEVNDIISTNIGLLEKAGEAADLTDEEIDQMIRTYMGFNDVEPIEIQAEDRASEIFEQVEENFPPDTWEIMIEALDEDAQAVMNALVEGDHETIVDILGNDDLARLTVEIFEDGDYQAVADLLADPMEANRVVWDFMTGEYVAVADVEGNTSPADQAMAAFLNGDYETVADIIGDDSAARATILQFMNGNYPTTTDIYGNDRPARKDLFNLTSTPWSTDVDIQGNRSPFDWTVGGINGATVGTAYIKLQALAQNVMSSAQSLISRVRGWGGGQNGGIAPNFNNGGLAGFSHGGRLPYTGLGTDMIMGVNSLGMPIARVDDGEFVIREPMTRKHLPALWAINRDDTESLKRYAAGLANGGVAGGYRPREFSAQASGAVQARQITEAIRTGAQSGAAGVNIENITAVGGDTQQVVNRVGDAIFRRLREEGVPVGSF